MKNLSKIMLAVAIMLLLAVSANAQNNSSTNQTADKQIVANSTARNFVDTDNNGVCDNLGTRSGKGQCGDFIDKNKDGVCDNRVNVGNRSGNNGKNGQGNQYRNGKGNQCRNGNGQGNGRGNCCKR